MNIKYKIKSFDGFSIFEFSIGLIISGLVIVASLFTTSTISKRRNEKLITSISNIKDSIAIFQTLNGFLPGDLFSSTIETSSSIQVKNTFCGNGDGIIAIHSICGNSATPNNRDTKCNVASYNSTTGDYALFNESLLFAKHLSDFGFVSRTLDSNPANYVKNSIDSSNTISSGYKNTFFLPMLFSSSSGLPSVGFLRSDRNHTIFITSSTLYLDSSNATNVYNANTITNASLSANANIFNTGNLCSSPPAIPYSFDIAFNDADYIDKKIDDGVRNTGSLKHCPSLASCSTSDSLSPVIIGFLQKFDQ